MDDKIKIYRDVQRNKITTSEIIKSSFTNVFDKLKVEDFIIVENQRQGVDLVIQTIDQYLGILVPSKKEIIGKVISIKDNILLAKQYIKENTYFLMKFESKNITFPKIEEILESNKNYGFDTQITKQLIEAWKYVINDKTTTSLSFLMDLHSIIAKDQALEWGVLRKGKVSITGTDYLPPIPNGQSVKKLLTIKGNIYEWVANTLPKMIKCQLFWDGNKRTSFLYMNKVLIENAAGIIVIPNKYFDKFNSLLNEYYNNEDKHREISKFISKNCFYNTIDKKFIK